MKTLTYFDGKPVRLGDVFQVARWGTCVVAAMDRRNACATALNIETGEEIDGLGQDTFGEADLLRRKPSNITRSRMSRELAMIRAKGGEA